MVEIETVNAKVFSTEIGFERGILCISLTLAWGVYRQMIGGYSIAGRSGATEFIERILKTLSVNSWESLPGTLVRIQCNGVKIFAIGHIMEDRWLTIAECDGLLLGGD